MYGVRGHNRADRASLLKAGGSSLVRAPGGAEAASRSTPPPLALDSEEGRGPTAGGELATVRDSRPVLDRRVEAAKKQIDGLKNEVTQLEKRHSQRIEERAALVEQFRSKQSQAVATMEQVKTQMQQVRALVAAQKDAKSSLSEGIDKVRTANMAAETRVSNMRERVNDNKMKLGWQRGSVSKLRETLLRIQHQQQMGQRSALSKLVGVVGQTRTVVLRVWSLLKAVSKLMRETS